MCFIKTHKLCNKIEKLYNINFKCKIDLCYQLKTIIMMNEQYNTTSNIKERVLITSQEMHLHEKLVRALLTKEPKTLFTKLS